MKKKVLAILLAMSVVGMYSFGSIAGVFAEDTATTSSAAAPVQVQNKHVVKAAPAPDTSTVAEVKTLAELNEALANGKIKTIDVAADIQLDGTQSVDHSVTLKSTKGNKLVRKAGFRDDMIVVKSGAELTLNDITIDGNKGSIKAYHPMIMVKAGGKLTINSGTALKDNEKPEVADNESSTSYGDKYGGAVHVDGGTLRMNGGTITGNGSECGSGVGLSNGAVMTMSDGIIENNSFTANIGKGDGGGVYIGAADRGENESPACTFTMTGGSIQGNSAADGGGVMVGNGNTFILAGGNVTDNTTSEKTGTGGGVNVHGTMSMKSGRVAGNTSGIGGGIFVLGTLNATGGQISGNKATYGGGINVAAQSGSKYNLAKASLSNTIISGNTAAYGGGVYNEQWFADRKATVELGNGTKVIGNNAKAGAGVYNFGSLSIAGADISKNTSSSIGGGIYNVNGYPSGKMSYNGVLTMTSGTITGNSASAGGGIYNIGKCSVLGGTISGNAPTSEKLQGSAIYLAQDVTLASAATIKGDCFVIFDKATNFLLKDSFAGHAQIEISVPEENSKYPSFKGFQVIKPAADYSLTEADRAAFKCIGNGAWGLKKLSAKDVSDNALLDIKGKADTIVLWDQETTYSVVANYYTSTNGGAFVLDGSSTKTEAASAYVGSEIQVTPEAAWMTYNGNTYLFDATKSTMTKKAVLDPKTNVLTVNYYRNVSSTNNEPTNNNTDNNGGGSANNTPSNNNAAKNGKAPKGSAVVKPSNNNANAPKTGDQSDIVLWAALGMAGIALAGVTMALRRKEQ